MPIPVILGGAAVAKGAVLAAGVISAGAIANSVISGDELTNEEKHIIEKGANKLIETSKNDSEAINKLMIECTTMLSNAETRVKEEAERSLWNKISGSITGENKKLRLDKEKRMIAAQYAAQKMNLILAKRQTEIMKKIKNNSNKINHNGQDIEELYKRTNKIVDVLKEEGII